MHATRDDRWRWTIGVVFVCSMTLAGCATSLPVEPLPAPVRAEPSRSEEEKNRFNASEAIEINADTQGDFDTAMTFLTTGKLQEGVQLMTKVTQRAPRHIAAHINLAIAYQKMGSLASAEESIKRALEINPEHAVANTEYGLIFRKTGRFTEARDAYERTLKRHPRFLPARKNLGILCDVYVGDLECALAQYRAYSTAAPDDKTVQIWITDLEKRMGKQQ